MPRKPRTTRSSSTAITTSTPKASPKPAAASSSPEIVELQSPEAFAVFLNSSPPNHGVFLTLCKLSAPKQTITYDGALRVALAHGWIDGQRKRHPSSPNHFLQRFTPRRKSSLWSKRNVSIVEELIASGVMTEMGMAEVTRAKDDGRWERAYSGGKDMVVPADFEAVLEGAAKDFWDQLGRGARFPFLMRLETCKNNDARRKKMEQFVALLAEGKSL